MLRFLETVNECTNHSPLRNDLALGPSLYSVLSQCNHIELSEMNE